MVHDARKAAALRALAAALVVSACGALAACGGGGGSGAPKPAAATTAARAARFDPVPFLATFTCRQWLVARAGTRASVVRALHRFYGSPVSGRRKTQAYGTVLSDRNAMRLFDDTCHRPYAIAFTLYKLYARAAAFAGQAP